MGSSLETEASLLIIGARLGFSAKQRTVRLKSERKSSDRNRKERREIRFLKADELGLETRTERSDEKRICSSEKDITERPKVRNCLLFYSLIKYFNLKKLLNLNFTGILLFVQFS